MGADKRVVFGVAGLIVEVASHFSLFSGLTEKDWQKSAWVAVVANFIQNYLVEFATPGGAVSVTGTTTVAQLVRDRPGITAVETLTGYTVGEILDALDVNDLDKRQALAAQILGGAQLPMALRISKACTSAIFPILCPANQI